jgi:S1-C subfamily serine protease
VPAQPAPTLSIVEGPAAGAAMRYVAAAEGTTGGVALRPLFLGRTDPVTDPRWPTPLLAMGGSPSAEPGSFVFALDGRLIGAILHEESLPALVSAPTLLEVAERLVRGQSVVAGDLGVQVQPLTPALSNVTRTTFGAVVALVAPRGPADGKLRIGDVIVAVDGRTMYSTADFRHMEASLGAGRTVRVEVMRRGDAHTVDLVARLAPSSTTVVDPFGLTLRPLRGRGALVIRVAPGSAAELGGLVAGDVIADLDGTPNPTPKQVRSAYDALRPGNALLLGVSRRDERLVLTVAKP